MCINQGKFNLGMSNDPSLACLLDALLGSRISPEHVRTPNLGFFLYKVQLFVLKKLLALAGVQLARATALQKLVQVLHSVTGVTHQLAE